MKAKESHFLDFLQSSKQFVIPIYQRPYRWSEPECRKLWLDVMRAGSDTSGAGHFIGSVVYIQDGLYNVTQQPAMLVIDGQQRLTTFMLMIEALARALGDAELPDGMTAKMLRHYYLKDSVQSGERAYKMLLSATDRTTLKALIDDKQLPDDHSIRIKSNFDLFVSLLEDDDVSKVYQGLKSILIVDISLERGNDNPQLIFESLNSTGKELGQADLIRNYVLMDLPPAKQTQLYEDHWRPMETVFGQTAYAELFDGFMRHYLTLKTGEIPNVKRVYDVFKAFAQDQTAAGGDIEALLSDIHQHAKFYCRMALGTGEPNKALFEALKDIRELKAEVTFPFLLELYADYEAQKLNKEDFLTALRLVEAYVFRRIICEIPTSSHNKTFSTFGRALHKDRYLDSMRAHFMTMPSYRRFPLDQEFQKAMQIRDLYSIHVRSYWLRRLENHERLERVAVEEYTIEHILPQNENLSDAWKEALGPTWKWVKDTYLHTLGNLTLTGYNSQLSDRPFLEKRDMLGGFHDSPLRLNEGIGKLHNWNEDAIKKRAERLSAKAAKVWRAPDLDAAAIANFKPKKQTTQEYSIADHSYLAGGTARKLFDALRAQVLALDPAVVEVFLKQNAVYRAEENFVAAIPQANRLKLILNMPFADLHDKNGVARDITNVGHWATGDIEIDFENISELSYVMGLVRQAYEWRMGSEGDT